MSIVTATTHTLATVDGETFWATPEMVDTINKLADANRGGFARVHGYKASTGYVEPTVYDATYVTRFSYSRLIERQRKAMNAITLSDLSEAIAREPKLAAASQDHLQHAFAARLKTIRESIDKTLAGDRSDAHRQAHDRCYANIAPGVVIHFATAKDADGRMQPIVENGHKVAESIMLNVIEISRDVKVKGVRKTVNSGVPVLMEKAIRSVLKAKGMRSMNRLSLKPDRFDSLSIGGNVIVPEDVVGLMDA